MDAVTSGNIKIDSVIKIKYVTRLKIEIEAQNHGICRMSGMLEDGMEAQQILSAMDDIPICIIRSEESSELLFRGIVKKADIYVVNGVYHTDLYAVTLSEMLDRTKCQRSFQNAMTTYEQVVKRVLEPYGNLSVFCAEEAQETINEPVIQYGETDWEFLMRLGSHLHIPLYADYLSKSRVLYFGMEKGRNITAEKDTYRVGINRGYYEVDRKKANVTRKDFLYYRVGSDENGQIGDGISIESCNHVIYKKCIELVHEKLEFTYQAGGCGNWYIPYIDHDRLTGMEFTGKVVSTQAEKMKVGLQIDEPYVGADHEWDWTPVSGNTMYAMPEKGNNVRLYFGSGTASEGTVASDVRGNGGSIPGQQKRTFTTAAGKKMELHPEHLSLQGGGGQAYVTDGQAVSVGSMTKVEMTASGRVRIEAAKLHVHTPQEINMYRSRAWCEEKGNNITSKGTKSNPPTGTGDAGFTFNNEFNVYVQVSVLCGTDFVCYRPFEDDPEEPGTYDEWTNWLILADNIHAGLTVVAAVALGAGYLASIVVTGGATLTAAPYIASAAPYIVGGLARVCGVAAVGGLAVRDIKSGNLSSKWKYMGHGAIAAGQGAYAGASFCMAPAAAESMVAFAAPAGIELPVVFITTKTLTEAAFLGAGTVTATNMVVKLNDSAAYVTGYNAIGSTFGQKPYEFVRGTSKTGSDLVFAFGLQNIMVCGTNRVNQQKVQGEGSSTTAFKMGENGKTVHNLTRDDIIGALDNGTMKSTEIANGLRNGDIKLNVLGDELFESYLGCSSDVTAMQVGNQIYVRSSSTSIFSDVVHEGTHVIDFINGIDEEIISSWTGETSAYAAEREFQLLKGIETQFATEDDMMVHIWSNYNR